MATSLLAAKSFPGIRVCKPGDPKTLKKSINFGLTRKSPRCAQCLKFKADDPSKIGEHEFGKLLRCSNCKKVNYCSKVCAEKNFPFHQLYCENGIQGLKNSEHSPPSIMFATAVMGEDANLFEELLDFAADETKFLNPVKQFQQFGGNFAERDKIIKEEGRKCLQPNSNALCNMILLCLGRDEEAYEFLKYSVSNFEKETNYELFKSMPKNCGKPNSRKEKFFAMDFFKRLLITTQKCTHSTCNCGVQRDLKSNKGFDSRHLVPYWLILVIIKINVIEEMKLNFNKMEAYFQRCKSRKKFKNSPKMFKNSPKILEGLAILHLGNDDTIGCSKGM